MSKQPKITIKEGAASPSQQLIDKAKATVTVTDSTGRVITLQKPGVLAQYRLIEALGETAQNSVYVGMVLPIIFVTKIDEDDVVLPKNKLQIEALIQRLDEHGINAVAKGVEEHFGATADPEKEKAAVKN